MLQRLETRMMKPQRVLDPSSGPSTKRNNIRSTTPIAMPKTNSSRKKPITWGRNSAARRRRGSGWSPFPPFQERIWGHLPFQQNQRSAEQKITHLKGGDRAAGDDQCKNADREGVHDTDDNEIDVEPKGVVNSAHEEPTDIPADRAVEPEAAIELALVRTTHVTCVGIEDGPGGERL
mmetsp:Transcript_1524/g.1867  ORF Transcript_1524/g.1867 Transcript_1524/m.1867 type:complete len:177 (-) Transcript_1524:700-1230(-)